MPTAMSPARSAALLLVLCAAVLAGCPTEHKLTLRHAEHMAWAWLLNMQEFLDPPTPSEAGDDGTDAAQDEDVDETDARLKPDTLRDCFVDDGWEPHGFKNPTEAIAWLTQRRRPLARVLSIDLTDDSAELAFELKDQPPVTLVAWIVMADGLPRCRGLTRSP